MKTELVSSIKLNERHAADYTYIADNSWQATSAINEENSWQATSVVNEDCLETGHLMDCACVEIIGKEDNSMKRKIKEAIEIRYK